MSNKSRLETNNTNLQSVLTTVQGLPKVNDVKHGLYVWKKSTKKATVTFVQTSHNPITLTASSSDIDLGTVDTNWFVGIKCNYSWATATYAFEFMENDVFVIWTADGTSHLYDGTYSYNQATKTITTNINPPGSFGINSSATKQGSFIQFVVADNANAYPDGGTQGGYWYEKMKDFMFGLTKETHGQFILSTDTEKYTLEHNLGAIPKFVVVYTNDSLKGHQYTVRSMMFVDRSSHDSTTTNNSLAMAELYNRTSYSSFEVFSNSGETIPMGTFDENSLPLHELSSDSFKAGATYYWQVMA